MQQQKKIKTLEIILLLTIIISIIVILLLVINTIKHKPKESTSNDIKNYSITKIHEYTSNITNSYKYNIPYPELINIETSNYTIHITSTDNYINTLNESIYIFYYPLLLEEQKNFIINYCNTYDIIETEYKLQCTFSNNTLNIKHQFNLNKLETNIITHNNLTITLPVTKDTKLDNYLKELNSLNIYPQQTESIS